ncbi:hypothetical protein E2C01_039654 [Portunus trituberculatus]|uniref:Uncharacterized protein n=1 Tax=Portunus trituberculatus TaxID=210409 RepID=A0A5B7FLV0_PORTR|nr:hypothetical protein [Portunus trituberculatus]
MQQFEGHGRMQGGDEDTVKLGTSSQAVYLTLPPCTYLTLPEPSHSLALRSVLRSYSVLHEETSLLFPLPIR